MERLKQIRPEFFLKREKENPSGLLSARVRYKQVVSIEKTRSKYIGMKTGQKNLKKVVKKRIDIAKKKPILTIVGFKEKLESRFFMGHSPMSFVPSTCRLLQRPCTCSPIPLSRFKRDPIILNTADPEDSLSETDSIMQSRLPY